MSEEAKRIGAVLKTKRKELHLSLKEVENSTSIRSAYLEAIEDGRVSDLISSVYAVGFIKQYAGFLGFDVESLLINQGDAFRIPGEKHEFSYGIGTLEVRGSMGGGVKWLPNLLWAGVTVLVIICAWYFAKFLGIL